MTVPGFCGRPCRSYLLFLTITLGLICGALSTDIDKSAKGRRLNGDSTQHVTENDTASDEEGHVRAEHSKPEHMMDLGMTWIEPENLPTEIQFERKLNMMGCGKLWACVCGPKVNVTQINSPPSRASIHACTSYHCFPNKYITHPKFQTEGEPTTKR